jgi:two-component system CheB/CheR fusion protein
MIQALSNLLGNAEKFTQRGGRVIVSLQRDDARVLLRVRDTGVGIAGALLPHVFEPFAQAPQSNDRSRGGLGLGLAMVKGLVQLHDGTVSITSDGPGHGTEVTIALPLETAAARPAALSEPLPSRSRRVLVIEDNADAADSLRDALTVLGHVVEVAYDGPGGLALARSFRPEIAICDIGLPSMDGYAVARAFRAEPALHGVYLVALSGYAQTEDRHRAGQAGFDRHVAKPAALDKLERVLAEAPVGGAGAGASPSPKTVS